MYYYRARYYSPSDGRFLQTDTWTGSIEDPSTLVNKYIYVGNNPINWIDPTGKLTEKQWRAVKLGAGLLGIAVASLTPVGSLAWAIGTSIGAHVVVFDLLDTYTEFKETNLIKDNKAKWSYGKLAMAATALITTSISKTGTLPWTIGLSLGLHTIGFETVDLIADSKKKLSPEQGINKEPTLGYEKSEKRKVGNR